MKRLFGFLLIAIGIVIAVSSFGMSFLKGNTVSVSNETSSVPSVKDLDEIIIRSSPVNIEVETHSAPSIEYSFKNGGDNFEILTNEKGSSYIIELKDKKGSGFFGFHKGDTLIVKLPELYQESLTLQSSAGNILFKGPVYLEHLSITTNAGNVKNVSGEIDYLTFEGAAGNFEGKDLKTKEAELKGTAGNIKLDGYSGALKGSNAAGNLKVRFSETNDEIEWKTTAGNIDIHIPKPNFEFDVTTSLGDVKIELPVEYETVQSKQYKGKINNGDYQLHLSTTLGNISIK